MGWNRSSESGGANTPGSPHVGQPKFALRSKGDGTARGKSPRPRWLRGAVAAVIVVVGAVSVWWLLSPSPTRQTSNVKHQTSKPSHIKEVKPASAPKPAAEEKKVAETAPAAPAEKPYWDTNKWELQNGFLVPKGARLVRNYLTNKVERIFKHSTDDTILAYLYPQPGGALAPMQPIMGRSDEIFLKSLNDPVIINEDDSEKVREQKELVIVARAQIKERMDAGEKFADILRENYRLMEENQKIRRDAQKELYRIYRDGDLEGAKKYKRVMDVALQQMGIGELKDPGENKKAARRMKDEEVR